MGKNNNKPKLRFPGFTDPWELRKLKEVAEIVGGGTPSTGNPEYWNGDIDWYSPTEIGDHVYARGSTKKITKLGLEKSSAKILPQDKTVLFTSRAGIGDMAILQRPGATNQGFQSLVLKEEIDTYFIYSMGHLIKKYAEKNASGSTFLEISGRTLGDMPILMPSTNEQTQIGTFFKTLDNLITLHQRKLNHLQYKKKGLLQKMFPKNGEDFPELRFLGFTDPWEQRKFLDLVTRVSKSSSEDKLPRVEYEDIISGQGILNKDIFDKESYKRGLEFEIGDTLFGKLRPYLQNWLLADFNGIAVGDWWVLRPNGISNKFIYNLIQSSNYQVVANLSTGTKMPRSDWNVVSQTEFAVPRDLEEQEKIGSFFTNIDNLITLHQRKLDHLQQQKKGLLQQMFI